MMTDREKLVDILKEYPYIYGTAEQLADFLIANGVMERKWISIREALPGLRERVLFHPKCNEKSIYIGELNAVGEYGTAYFAVRVGNRKTCYNATHWMPLPELPEEDNHETD